MTIDKYILITAKEQMEYYYKFDKASRIDLPVGKITLKNGIEAQVILKVITEPSDFIFCTNYQTHSGQKTKPTNGKRKSSNA